LTPRSGHREKKLLIAMKKVLQFKDFEILDSIRGIAALFVTIAHCRGTLWMGGGAFAKMFPRDTWNVGDYLIFGFSMLTRLSVEFVIVFFVLSGFSIAHSLSSNTSVKQFYLRRLIRIYPSYLVALIWAGLVVLLTRYWHPNWYDGSWTTFSFERTVPMNTYFEPKVILRNIFYMTDEQGMIAPFWSLTYEVIFYLLAPFVFRRVNLYIGVSVFLFFFHLLFPEWIRSLHIPRYFYNFLFLYNIYFSIGVALYKNYERVKSYYDRLTKKIHLSLIVVATMLTYATNIYFQVGTVYSFFSAAVLGVLLILFFLKYQVQIPWLINIGRFSYTLYIVHYPTIFLYLGFYHLIFHPDVPYIQNYFVWMPAVLFCLGIAYLHYLLVESKTKYILNRMRSRRTGKVAAA
jgi:peptidoglycan/LPS O-acetylase OafA/YrhL